MLGKQNCIHFFKDTNEKYFGEPNIFQCFWHHMWLDKILAEYKYDKKGAMTMYM